MRRALVIGLGGCGCRVVRMLKERVEWRYGGLEKTTFLQLLGIDTAKDAGLEGEDLFVHMTVHREDFRRLIEEVRLGRERPDIEPHRWLDIQVVGDKTEISEGAVGIRMVGRLAFLFPTNFNAVVARLRAKLEKLCTMTDEEASKAFGETLQLSEGLRHLCCGDPLCGNREFGLSGHGVFASAANRLFSPPDPHHRHHHFASLDHNGHHQVTQHLRGIMRVGLLQPRWCHLSCQVPR